MTRPEAGVDDLLAAAGSVPEPSVRRVVEEAASLDPERAGTDWSVLGTLRIALWAVSRYQTFEDAVVAAVNLGGDADTTGAVTGALAGAQFGITGIPGRWLAVLRVREEADALAARLFELARS